MEMADHVSELSNSELFLMAKLDTHRGAHNHVAAARERLRREIIVAEGCDHERAIEILLHINEKNTEHVHLYKLPYSIGILTARAAGVLSLPLVFSLPVALKFNEYFVTSDYPAEGEGDTWLEVRASARVRNRLRPPCPPLSALSTPVPLFAHLVRSTSPRASTGGHVDVELDGAAARHHFLLPPLHGFRTGAADRERVAPFALGAAQTKDRRSTPGCLPEVRAGQGEGLCDLDGTQM